MYDLARIDCIQRIIPYFHVFYALNLKNNSYDLYEKIKNRIINTYYK